MSKGDPLPVYDRKSIREDFLSIMHALRNDSPSELNLSQIQRLFQFLIFGSHGVTSEYAISSELLIQLFREEVLEISYAYYIPGFPPEDYFFLTCLVEWNQDSLPILKGIMLLPMLPEEWDEDMQPTLNDLHQLSIYLLGDDGIEAIPFAEYVTCTGELGQRWLVFTM